MRILDIGNLKGLKSDRRVSSKISLKSYFLNLSRNRRLQAFSRNKASVVSLIFIFIVIFSAVFAPFIAPYDPVSQNLLYKNKAPSGDHIMGTDKFGRDQLSRIIYGARVALIIGFTSILISATFGTFIGILAGYKRGKIDSVIGKFVDVAMSFPSLLLGIMVVATFGTGFYKVIIAVAFASIPRFIRIARAATLSIRDIDFIVAAKSVGASDLRILILYLFPNIIDSIVVMGTVWMGIALRVESSLSFLGLGVQPPNPGWGLMLRDGMDQLSFAPHLTLFPGICIFLTILAFNMVGDGLRDALDPKIAASRQEY
jgi:peptide/nickel transport system permease protein